MAERYSKATDREGLIASYAAIEKARLATAERLAIVEAALKSIELLTQPWFHSPKPIEALQRIGEIARAALNLEHPNHG